MSRIIVKNLPDKITKEKLFQIFSEKGIVTDVQLKFTKEGKFRKFAFIGYKNAEQAEEAKKSLDKSFINTSRIQIETCAQLGDVNKPRPWSKYAPENSVLAKKRNEEKDSNHEREDKKLKKQTKKERIKDPKIKELLKNHQNDKLFNEFMEINAPELVSDLLVEKKEESENEDESEHDDETENDEIKKEENFLANENISDADYIKLKTGKNIELKKEAYQEKPIKSFGKPVKSIQLYTVKITGLPLKIKKSEIKQFLKPLKAFTIRKALKIKGLVYCGFKTEKEMKTAVLKNRTFFGGRRIYVTPQKVKKVIDNVKEIKWKLESEKLKGLETVAESGRIFVRNLPYIVTEEELKEKFEKYGPITEFILPIDSFTRKLKGFAIVTYLIPEHACKAFNELDGTIFSGRMLHLLPALPSDETENNDSSGASFKEKKLKKEKALSKSSLNWNTFFVGENALAETIAATYNTTKENVLDDKQSGAAVRLALGETQLVTKIKEFLEENDVCLESFNNMAICPRSNTVILLKNLPFGTKPDEIREKFSKFGLLKRVVLPPSGVAALVEFVEPSEAKIAFRRLSYSKFKHVPLYLEWAPDKVFTKDAKKTDESEDKQSKGNEAEETAEKKSENKLDSVDKDAVDTEENLLPEEGAIIFVKNLNFKTGEEALRRHFEPCGKIISVTISRKTDPKHPGEKLSMGYGFVNFLLKESADKALKTLQFSNLDDHKVELKRSNRTVESTTVTKRKTSKNNEKPSPKLLVRNVPFQATKKEIWDLFKVFGEIKSVRLPKKMVGTGSHRGFCFVEYNTINDAKRAFKALSQSTHLYGRRLVLEWAATDEDVETLREKTAQQFKSGVSTNTKNKKINMEDYEEDDE